MPEDITTIKLSKKTKARLDNLKVYKNETYEEILEKMLETFNLVRNSPEQAHSRLLQLEQERKRNLNK